MKDIMRARGVNHTWEKAIRESKRLRCHLFVEAVENDKQAVAMLSASAEGEDPTNPFSSIVENDYFYKKGVTLINPALENGAGFTTVQDTSYPQCNLPWKPWVRDIYNLANLPTTAEDSRLGMHVTQPPTELVFITNLANFPPTRTAVFDDDGVKLGKLVGYLRGVWTGSPGTAMDTEMYREARARYEGWGEIRTTSNR